MNAASSNSTASEYDEEEGEEGQQRQQQQQHQQSLFVSGNIKGPSAAAAANRPIKRPGSAGGGPTDGMSQHTGGYVSAAAAAAYQRFSHPGVLTTGGTTAGSSMYSSAHHAGMQGFASGNEAAGGSGSSSVQVLLQPGDAFNSGVAGYDRRVQPPLSRFAPDTLGAPATTQYLQQQQGPLLHAQQQWGGPMQQVYHQAMPGSWEQQLQQQPLQQSYQQQRQQHYQQLQQRGTAFRGPSGLAAAAAAAPGTTSDTCMPTLPETYRAAGAGEYSGGAAAAAAAAAMPEQHSAPPKLHVSASGTFLAHSAALGGRFSDVGGLAAVQGSAAAGAEYAQGMSHCWSYHSAAHVEYSHQQQQQQRSSSGGAYMAQQQQQQLKHEAEQQHQQQQQGYVQQQQGYIQQQQQQQQPAARLLSGSASDSHLLAHAGSAPLPRDADVAAHGNVVVKPDHHGSMSPTPLPQRPHHSSYPGQLPPPPKQQLWPTQQQQQPMQPMHGQLDMLVKPDLHLKGSSEERFRQGMNSASGEQATQLSAPSSSREAEMNSLRAAMQAAAAAAAAAGAKASVAAAAAAPPAAAPGVAGSMLSAFSMSAQQVQVKGVSTAEDMVCSGTDSPCLSAAGMLGSDLGGINLGPGWQQQQQQQQQICSSWPTEHMLLTTQQQQQQQQQQLMPGSSSSAAALGAGASTAVHLQSSAAPVAPGYGSVTPGGFPVPESDMFRAMSGADDDFSELFDLLLEGTEQQ
jgi:hypothetical protein